MVTAKPTTQNYRTQYRQGHQEYTVPEQSRLAMAGPSQSFSCQKLKCSTAVGILVYDRLYIEQNPDVQKPACCRRETGVTQSCFQSYCEGQRGDMWLPGPSHCDSKTHRLPPVVGSPGWKSGCGGIRGITLPSHLDWAPSHSGCSLLTSLERRETR